MRISANSLVGVLVISLPLWSGCAGKSTDECIIGTQSCICYPNNSCDEPFVCNASTNVCMQPLTAGAGGNSSDDGSGGATTGGSGTTGENGAGVSGVAGASETGGVSSTGGTSGVGGSSSGGVVGVGGESTGGSATGGAGGESAATGGQPQTGGMSSTAGRSGGESTGGTTGASGNTGVGGAAGSAGGGPMGGASTAGTSGEGGAGAPTHIPDDRAPCVNIGFIGEDRSTADGAAPNQVIDWLGTLDSVNVVRIEATAPLTDELLQPLHAIIVGNMQSRVDAEALEEVAPYSEVDIDVLTAWVEGGGGLLTLAGYTGDENAALPATELLSYMGLGYDYVGRGSGVVGEGSPPNLLSPVSGVTHRVVAGVTQLGAYLGYPVTTENASDRVLIRSGDFDLAVAHTQGEGRVLVYFDDWITLVSEWPNHTDLQHEVFWRNTLNWLLAPVDCSLPG